MTVVKIGCRCGVTSEVPAASLLLEIAGEHADESVGGSLTWICQACSELVAQPVGWAALLALVTAGVPLVDEDDSDPRDPHPELPPDGAPFNADDQLELHQLLGSPTWFEALVAATRAGS